MSTSTEYTKTADAKLKMVNGDDQVVELLFRLTHFLSSPLGNDDLGTFNRQIATAALDNMQGGRKTSHTVLESTEESTTPLSVTALSALSAEAQRMSLEELKKMYDPAEQEAFGIKFGMHADVGVFQMVVSTTMMVCDIDRKLDAAASETKQQELLDRCKITSPLDYFLEWNTENSSTQRAHPKSKARQTQIYESYKDLCRNYLGTKSSPGIVGLCQGSFKILPQKKLFERVRYYGAMLDSYRYAVGIPDVRIYNPDEMHKLMQIITADLPLSSFKKHAPGRIEQFQTLCMEQVDSYLGAIEKALHGGNDMESDFDDDVDDAFVEPRGLRRSARNKKKVNHGNESSMDKSVSVSTLQANPSQYDATIKTAKTSPESYDFSDDDEEEDNYDAKDKDYVEIRVNLKEISVFPDAADPPSKKTRKKNIVPVVPLPVRREQAKQHKKEADSKLIKAISKKSKGKSNGKAGSKRRENSSKNQDESQEQHRSDEGSGPADGEGSEQADDESPAITHPLSKWLLTFESPDPKDHLHIRNVMEALHETSGTLPVIVQEVWRDIETGKLVNGPEGPDFRSFYEGEDVKYKLESITIMSLQPCGMYAFADECNQHGALLRENIDEILQSDERKWTTVLDYKPGTLSLMNRDDFRFLQLGDKRFDEFMEELEKKLDVAFFLKRFLNLEIEDMEPGAFWDVTNGEVPTVVIELNNERGLPQAHIGFAGTHSTERTDKSQVNHEGTVLPIPNLVNEKDDELYRKVGPVAELVFKFMKKYCRNSDGSPLMSDPQVNAECRPFSDKMGVDCNFMAATVALQPVALLTKEETGRTKMEYGRKSACDMDTDEYEYWMRLKRHLDGKNSRKKGYHMSGIFWAFIVMNGIVFRLTFIFYSRKSITDLVEKKFEYVHPVTREIMERINQENGGKSYESWSLKKDMSQTKAVEVRENQAERNGGKGWRLPEVNEEGKVVEKKPLKPLEWLKMTFFSGLVLFYISLPEFVSRFGFVSSFIWIINKLTDKYELSRERRLELAYIALLSASQPLFVAVLKFWHDNEPGFDWEDPKVSLLEKYHEYVETNTNFKARGGPRTRFQGQGDQNWPTCNFRDKDGVLDQNALDQQMKFLEEDIERLRNGEDIKAEAFGIKDVACLSFASLMLFTGLVEPTPEAIGMAERPKFNKRGPYFKGPKKIANRLGLDDHAKELLAVPQRFSDLMKYLSFYLGICVEGIENVFCAISRADEAEDFFFFGQDLYMIKNGEMLIKEFETEDYLSFKEIRELQKQNLTNQLPANPLPIFNV
ncbi:MAG: hypothetical protein SGILL_003036 [Bacillariaceae sp.]